MVPFYLQISRILFYCFGELVNSQYFRMWINIKVIGRGTLRECDRGGGENAHCWEIYYNNHRITYFEPKLFKKTTPNSWQQREVRQNRQWSDIGDQYLRTFCFWWEKNETESSNLAQRNDRFLAFWTQLKHQKPQTVCFSSFLSWVYNFSVQKKGNVRSLPCPVELVTDRLSSELNQTETD